MTVFAARHDLYDDYSRWCEKYGADMNRVKRLPAFQHDCLTARNEDNHGNEWKRKVRNAYNRGHSAVKIHKRSRKLFGESLPCQRDSQCPYMADREYDPDDYDILIGHYTHAYSWKPTAGRFLVFDEFPENDFLVEFESGDFQEAISDYVSSHDGFPLTNAKQVLAKRDLAKKHRPMVEAWLTNKEDETAGQTDAYERQPAMRWYAADLLRTGFLSDELANEWEYCDLGKGRIAVRSPKDGAATILEPPTIALENAESIIALDGTPTVEKWQLMLGDDLRRLFVLEDDASRQEYLRTGLSVRLIQTTDDPKPYLNRTGRNVKVDQDMALLEAIQARENQQPAVISSKKAIQLYTNAGLEKIVDDVDERTNYYGNLKGTNDFDRERLGVVIGSPHPSDEEIQKWAALAGESVERHEDEHGNPTMGKELTFGPFGDTLLHGMRENEVLQAALRFGRRAEDGERGATVYVHTGALPEWVNPEQDHAIIRKWGGPKNGLRKVIDAIHELDDWQSREWRAEEIKEMVATRYDDEDDLLSIQTVRSHLRTLEKYGYLTHRQGDGRGRPKLWQNVCLETAGNFGHVVFESDSEIESTA